MNMLKRTLIGLGLILGLTTPAWAQLGSVPYTFSAGTTIRSAEMNANFSAAFSDALSRSAGILTGSLSVDTTNAYDLGSASLMFRSEYLRTSLVLGQTTANYTLTWADPAAARAISIADPGGTDVFTFNAATQTLTNKTLTAPVLSGTVTGTYTLGGTPTFDAASFSFKISGTTTFIMSSSGGRGDFTVGDNTGAAAVFIRAPIGQSVVLNLDHGNNEGWAIGSNASETDLIFYSGLAAGAGTKLTLSETGVLTAVGAFTSSASVALTGTTNNVGTITSGIWNAGAVTSSGSVAGQNFDFFTTAKAGIKSDLSGTDRPYLAFLKSDHSTVIASIEARGDLSPQRFSLDLTGDAYFNVSGTSTFSGGIYVTGDVSALTFTDRTPFPFSLDVALDAVMSMRRLPDNLFKVDDVSQQLDHASLSPFVRAVNGQRDLSSTVSAVVVVAQSHEARIAALEARASIMQPTNQKRDEQLAAVRSMRVAQQAEHDNPLVVPPDPKDVERRRVETKRQALSTCLSDKPSIDAQGGRPLDCTPDAETKALVKVMQDEAVKAAAEQRTQQLAECARKNTLITRQGGTPLMCAVQ